jgi:hypothetical protein
VLATKAAAIAPTTTNFCIGPRYAWSWIWRAVQAQGMAAMLAGLARFGFTTRRTLDGFNAADISGWIIRYLIESDSLRDDFETRKLRNID